MISSTQINIDNTPTTTTFVDDGRKQTNRFKTIETDTQPIREQAIKDFLRKPVLINTQMWSTAQTRDTNLFTLQPGFFTEAMNDWKNKLSGYAMYRGTAVVTVIINANPFQQGRLLLHFLPAGGANVDRNVNMVLKTQHPNVELDCRDSAASLAMPYVAPTDWYSRYDSALQCPWGVFYLDVLSPLSVGSAGETTVEVTSYLHWEDLELAAPVIPQSGSMRVKKYKSMEEVEKASPMSLSQGLACASRAADELGQIPLLAPVAVPASWVATALSNIASFFGYSKPANDKPGTAVHRLLIKDSANSTGEFAGPRLGLRGDNRLTILDDHSIRKEDEMSFQFLRTRECFVGSFSWDVATTTNTNLYTQRVNPIAFATNYARTRGGKILTVRTQHPISFIARHFANYRGGLKLKFKFVKTQFHSGRLQMTYLPFSSTVSSAPSISNSTLALREIVDINTMDEITIDLPYMLPTAYSPIATDMGQFDIIVLNQLRAPETCSTSIEVLVYLTFADDFELQAPISTNNITASAAPITLQSGEMMPKVGQPDSEGVEVGIGDHTPQQLSTFYSQRAVGEHFSSLRQLLLMFSRYWTKDTPNGNGQLVWPYFVGMNYQDSGTGSLVATGGPYSCDIFSRIAPMYAFYRGGMRFIIVPSKTGPPMHMCLTNDVTPGTSLVAEAPNTSLNYQGAFAWTSPSGTTNFGDVGHTYSDADTNICAFEVPYLSRTKMSFTPTIKQSSVGTVPVGIDTPITRFQYTDSDNATRFSSPATYRAIAEDFQFSYFLCTPLEFVSLV